MTELSLKFNVFFIYQENTLILDKKYISQYSKILLKLKSIYLKRRLQVSVEIKNVVFDFGGVLFDWNQRYFYRSIFNDDEKMEYFLSNIGSFFDGNYALCPKYLCFNKQI